MLPCIRWNQVAVFVDAKKIMDNSFNTDKSAIMNELGGRSADGAGAACTAPL
jgi:hypothetical protein